jgi:hypothetical protein
MPWTFIGADRVTGDIILFICDHLPWSEDHQETLEHMYLLQEKLNKYIGFIESGEINARYP